MREILPIELHDKSEELVEKYVELLHFLSVGIEHGKQRIQRAERRCKENPTDNDRKELKRAIEVLPDRSKLRYPSKNDLLLDELERLGLIRTKPSKDEVISRLVELTEDISDKHHAVLTMYKGVYPKRPLHIKTDNASILLDSIRNRGRRSTEILRDAYTEDDHGWAFYVPRWFNDALDIKLIDQNWNTVSRLAWMQGNGFSFKEGYMLYETKRDYKLGRARLQVISGQSAGGTEKTLFEGTGNDGENDEGGIITERFTGSVKYRDFSDNSVKTTSQDNFVRILIEGEKKTEIHWQGVLF